MKQLLAIIILCTSIAGCSQELSQWVEVRGGAWKPSESVLHLIKNQIEPQALVEAKKRGRIPVSTLKNYTFQYQGQTEGASITVKIQAYCQARAGFDPAEDWLVVLDGGVCYLNALYDVESNKCMYLYFNREG